MIYNLIIFDKDTGSIFNIGFFESQKIAEEIGEKYLNSVEGFKDFNCYYKIFQKNLDDKIFEDFYLVYGWNDDEVGNPIEILESDCFSDKSRAKTVMYEMKKIYLREHWCIDKFSINKCLWEEGYTKIYDQDV